MKGVLPVLESPVHLLWSTWVPKLTYFQLSRCYAHAICESDWVNCSPHNAVPTYLVLTIKYTTICQCKMLRFFVFPVCTCEVLRSPRHWNRYRNSISCWWYLDSKFCISVQWKIYLKLLASELKQIGVSKRSGRALLTLINGMWITSGSDCCVCQWRKCNVHG